MADLSASPDDRQPQDNLPPAPLPQEAETGTDIVPADPEVERHDEGALPSEPPLRREGVVSDPDAVLPPVP
jgi:hypothetical protein